MAFLAASNCFDFTQRVSSALRPKEPKAKDTPRVSLRFLLVASLCHFLNFTLLGNSIFFFVKNFSLINPDLYSQITVRQMRPASGKINIGAQRLQRNLSFFQPFVPRHLRAVQPPRKRDFRAL